MIGLMFYGAIGLWGLIAFYLGRKLPGWFKLKPAWSFLFVPLVFFAPVIDQVIAIPQAYVLCKQAEEAFWYDPAAKGKIRMKDGIYLRRENLTVGFNIIARVEEYGIRLAESGAVTAKWTEVRFSPGFIKLFAGEFSPVVLQDCPIFLEPKIDAMKKELQLTVESNPS